MMAYHSMCPTLNRSGRYVLTSQNTVSRRQFTMRMLRVLFGFAKAKIRLTQCSAGVHLVS